MTILRNMAKCLGCGETIESENVHDFRTCECGNLSVDGGTDYLRRLYGPVPFEEKSVTTDGA